MRSNFSWTSGGGSHRVCFVTLCAQYGFPLASCICHSVPSVARSSLLFSSSGLVHCVTLVSEL